MGIDQKAKLMLEVSYHNFRSNTDREMYFVWSSHVKYLSKHFEKLRLHI